jgi:hypothetical protein
MFQDLDTPEEERNFIPKDFEEFFQFLKKKSFSDFKKLKLETCLICSDEMEASVEISRKCQCSQYPCEGHTCECSSKNAYPSCFNCLSTHLWEKSSAKFIGRFRAKCPFCKAEFCSNDLIFIPLKTEKKPKKQSVEQIIKNFVKSKETEFVFPKTTTSTERKKIHEIAEKYKLKHFSEGENENRVLKLLK